MTKCFVPNSTSRYRLYLNLRIFFFFRYINIVFHKENLFCRRRSLAYTLFILSTHPSMVLARCSCQLCIHVGDWSLVTYLFRSTISMYCPEYPTYWKQKTTVSPRVFNYANAAELLWNKPKIFVGIFQCTRSRSPIGLLERHKISQAQSIVGQILQVT